MTIITEWDLITPEKAHAHLAKNTNNRNLRNMRVARMARDIQNGHWVKTHQGIAFDVSGTLLDGQHRLMAVIQADIPVEMLVTYNLSPEAQRHMDRGAARLASDFLSGPNRVAQASALRYLLAVSVLAGRVTPQDLDQATRTLVTDADIYEAADTHPGLVGDLAEVGTLTQRASKYAPVGPSSLLLAAATFPGVAEEALESLATGAGLERGNPILALRNYNHRITRVAVAMTTALSVFSRLDKGKSLSRLTVNPNPVRPLVVPVAL